MSPRTRTTPDDPAEPTVSADGDAAADGGAAVDAVQDDSTEELTYEQARDELVQVVARLEAGGVPLEDSLALWERGEALAARCQRWLDGARARLDAALASEDATRGH